MSKHRKTTTFILLLVLMSVSQMSTDIYLPSIPVMAEQLNTSLSLVQFSVSIGFIIGGLIQFVYGPASDYYGRRTPLLIGLSLFITGSLVAVFAQNIETLLTARVIQGLGMGSMIPLVTSITKDMFTDNELIKAFSYMSVAYAVSPIIAPVIGGYLQEYFNWHANFIAILLMASVLMILFLYHLPETNKNKGQGSFSLRSVLKDYSLIISNKYYMSYLTLMVMVFAIEIAYILSTPFIFQELLSLSPVENGWLILITAVAIAIGALLAGRFVEYISAHKLILIGIACQTMGALSMLGAAFLNILNIWVIVIPMIFAMLGAGIMWPSASSSSFELFPKKSGSAGAMMGGSLWLGAGFLGSLVVQAPQYNQLTLALFITLFTSINLLVFITVLRKYNTD